MPFLNSKWRSLFLLFSVLLFFVATPFLENRERGEPLLVANMYLTLMAATAELSEKRPLFLAAIPLAGASMILLWLSHVYPARALAIASHLGLTTFLGLVSVSLFVYLGRKGQIGSDRIYVSVCLYFLIALEWFSIYSLINILQPGSFAEAGTILGEKIAPSKLLYFSLCTLTTLGFGDIVPVRPAARIFTALEAGAGVLFIAITVARLVTSYQTSHRDSSAAVSGSG